MRKIVFALLLIILLAACNGGTPAATPITNLQFITTSTNITPEETRLVIVLWRGSQHFSGADALQVAIHDPNQPDHPITWEGEAVLYEDYEFPYWVVYPDFAAPGLWQVDLRVQLAGGGTVEGNLFAKVDAESEGITVGMAAIPSQTLTQSDDHPLFTITSDPHPNEALYQQTVAEAVQSGRPSLVIFATPGMCSSFICTPILESAVDPLYERYHKQMNFVHVEVYDLQTSAYVAAMDEWGLRYEPWTYLIDANGVVAARFDGPVSMTELQPDLARLLGEP